MLIKLSSKNDVLNLPRLPLEISASKTVSYIASTDEVTQAEEHDIAWVPRWFDGRLYRVRSADLWETKHY